MFGIIISRASLRGKVTVAIFSFIDGFEKKKKKKKKKSQMLGMIISRPNSTSRVLGSRSSSSVCPSVHNI